MLANIIMDKLIRLKDNEKNTLKLSSDDVIDKIEKGTATKIYDNITIDTNSIQKIGKLVHCYFQIKANADIPASTYLIELPTEFKPAVIYNGIATTNNNTTYTFWLANTNGRLAFRTQIPNNTTVRVDIMYYTQ